MNYTVEKEDGAYNNSPTTVVENVILGATYTYLIENAHTHQCECSKLSEHKGSREREEELVSQRS